MIQWLNINKSHKLRTESRKFQVGRVAAVSGNKSSGINSLLSSKSSLNSLQRFYPLDALFSEYLIKSDSLKSEYEKTFLFQFGHLQSEFWKKKCWNMKVLSQGKNFVFLGETSEILLLKGILVSNRETANMVSSMRRMIILLKQWTSRSWNTVMLTI